MNDKLQQQLLDRFPFMEATSVSTGKKLGFPIHHDFLDGWYDVIYSLCEKIEWDLLLYPNPDFAVLQSKEKYGILCFYTSSIPLESKIFDYILEAEVESSQTCEECGSKDNVSLHGEYWVKRRCDICANKM